MKVRTVTATGRRTPSGVMTSAMPALVQAGDVDGVVADAEPRDDGEPAIGRNAALVEARAEQDEGVEALEVGGAHDAVDRMHVGDLAAGRGERREVDHRIGRRAVGFEEIAAERDAELRHGSGPRLLRSAGRPGAGADRVEPAAHRLLQRPHVARPAHEVEAARRMVDAARGVRHEPPERLAVPCAAAPIRSTASANLGCVNSPGMPSEDDQVEMPDPQAVDALDGGDGVDMLDPGGGLDEREQAGPLVCGGEPLMHRAGAAEIVVRDAERDAAARRAACI